LFSVAIPESRGYSPGSTLALTSKVPFSRAKITQPPSPWAARYTKSADTPSLGRR
jgi:hypothetical protein